MVLSDFMKVVVDSAEWVVHFEERATKKKVLSKVANSCILKARFRPSLSRTCNSRRKIAWEKYVKPLVYNKNHQEFGVAGCRAPMCEEEVTLVQQIPLTGGRNLGTGFTVVEDMCGYMIFTYERKRLWERRNGYKILVFLIDWNGCNPW